MAEGQQVIETLLRRDRWIVAAAVLVLLLLSWAYLLAGAGMGMTALDMTRMVYGDHSVMSAAMAPRTGWSVGYALLMFCMWSVMMIAMMLPSATPVILLAAAINRKAAPDIRPYGATRDFLAGYLLIWVLFSAIATGLQWGFERSGCLSAMSFAATQRWFSALLLLIAAIWQLSPLKHACLRQCQSPVQLLVAARHRSALHTGLKHGLYCVGCCWSLMLLLFVGGVMNLLWIAGLAVMVLLEKLLPGGRLLAQASALVLAVAALAIMLD